MDYTNHLSYSRFILFPHAHDTEEQSYYPQKVTYMLQNSLNLF